MRRDVELGPRYGAVRGEVRLSFVFGDVRREGLILGRRWEDITFGKGYCVKIWRFALLVMTHRRCGDLVQL